jgi:hypothetical protein
MNTKEQLSKLRELVNDSRLPKARLQNINALIRIIEVEIEKLQNK